MNRFQVMCFVMSLTVLAGGVCHLVGTLPGGVDERSRLSRPGGAPTLTTRLKAARIKAGMAPAEVVGILGRCAFRRTDTEPDGAVVELAIWIVGDDTIGVLFQDGRAAMVLSAAIGPPPGPGSRPANG